MVNFDVSGKVALISGGASGIGFQLALNLLSKVAKGVTLADINPVFGKKAIEEIEEKYGKNRAVYVKTDVCNYNEFEDAFKTTVEKFGNIDILINNAGVFDDNNWEREVEINMKGTIRGMLLGLENYIPKYKSGPDGLILNMSSISATSPYGAIPIYAAIKCAMNGMTLAWGCREHYERTNVRVVSVCPGRIKTPILSINEEQCLRPLYLPMLQNLLSGPKQSLEEAIPPMMQIIEKAESGTLWVVENNEPPYRYDLPDRSKIPRIFL